MEKSTGSFDYQNCVHPVCYRSCIKVLHIVFYLPTLQLAVQGKMLVQWFDSFENRPVSYHCHLEMIYGYILIRYGRYGSGRCFNRGHVAG